MCGGGGGGGGNRWPRLTLKITSSIGNKQLSSTATPGKCWTPFGTKNYIFSELMEYNEGMLNILGESIRPTGSETKRPVHVVKYFQLSDKPQSLQ